ncbi:MAG: hypothetical protein JNL24_00050 [Bacteroidia bacterium]|nr:hypothetical protein [Bacteroidia bacterium]
MDELNVNHIYLRLFDVDWNSFEKEALPVGTINKWWNGEIGNQEITPCIYITNTVIKNSSKKQLDSLALKIKKRTTSILSSFSESYARNKVWELETSGYQCNCDRDSLHHIVDSLASIEQKHFDNKIKDLLIDCDWTKETRDNYFYFLSRLKRHLPSYQINATIRLWQYKNKKIAGIPPIERGLLMCYNTNNPADYSTNNSIASLEQIEQYYTTKPYPIKLDIALPLFNWGVIYHNKQFKGLLSGVNPNELIADTLNYKQTKENMFTYRTDMVVGDQYIRNGDEIKIEHLSAGELEAIIRSIHNNIEIDNKARITFFSLDTTEINNYGIDKIKNMYQLFHN